MAAMAMTEPKVRRAVRRRLDPRELQGDQASMEIMLNLKPSLLPPKRGSVEMRLLVRCFIMKTGKSAHVNS